MRARAFRTIRGERAQRGRFVFTCGDVSAVSAVHFGGLLRESGTKDWSTYVFCNAGLKPGGKVEVR